MLAQLSFKTQKIELLGFIPATILLNLGNYEFVIPWSYLCRLMY